MGVWCLAFYLVVCVLFSSVPEWPMKINLFAERFSFVLLPGLLVTGAKIMHSVPSERRSAMHSHISRTKARAGQPAAAQCGGWSRFRFWGAFLLIPFVFQRLTRFL